MPIALLAPSETGDVMELTFDWPLSFEVALRGQQTLQREIDGRPAGTWSSRLGCTLVRSQVDRVDVRHRWRTVIEPYEREGPMLGQAAGLAMQSLPVSFQLDEHGHVSMLDPDDTQHLLDGWRRQHRPTGLAPDAAQVLARVFTPQAAAQATASFWNVLVAGWVGEELTLGDSVRGVVSQPMPMLGGVAVDYEVELGAEGPFDDGSVLLTKAHRPDGERMRLALEAVRSAGSGGLRVLDYQEIGRTSLRALPESLLPLAVESVRRVEVTQAHPSREPWAMTEEMRVSFELVPHKPAAT